MTETILKLKTSKNHTEKISPSREISPLSVKKGGGCLSIGSSGSGNQPFFSINLLSHLQVVKSSIMETMSLKKGYDLTYRERLSMVSGSNLFRKP